MTVLFNWNYFKMSVQRNLIQGKNFVIKKLNLYNHMIERVVEHHKKLIIIMYLALSPVGLILVFYFAILDIYNESKGMYQMTRVC
jgi:hypothetical protein